MSYETLQTLSTDDPNRSPAGRCRRFGAYHFGQKIQREKDAKSATSGTLKPERRVVLSTKERALPEMEFGDSGAVLLLDAPQGTPLMKFADDNKLLIEMDDHAVKVSIIIHDPYVRVVAELSRNEWKTNPNATWDRNYSANALEVKDNQGDVVLQVRLVGTRVQLQAKFYDSIGRGIGIGTTDKPAPGGIIELSKPGEALKLHINPIFKYPSDLHFGELN